MKNPYGTLFFEKIKNARGAPFSKKDPHKTHFFDETPEQEAIIRRKTRTRHYFSRTGKPFEEKPEGNPYFLPIKIKRRVVFERRTCPKSHLLKKNPAREALLRRKTRTKRPCLKKTPHGNPFFKKNPRETHLFKENLAR